jgi:hypothetical protein
MNGNLAFYFCSYLQVLFTCPKILRHGASGFTFPPKEGVFRIFIAFKNPSPRPGFDTRIFRTVANTTLCSMLFDLSFKLLGSYDAVGYHKPSSGLIDIMINGSPNNLNYSF